MKIVVTTVKCETGPMEWPVPAGIDKDSLTRLIWARKRDYSQENFTIAAKLVFEEGDEQVAAQETLEMKRKLEEAALALCLPQANTVSKEDILENAVQGKSPQAGEEE